MSTYEFGEWDADSSSFYNPGPASSTGPLGSFLSPLLLSTVRLSPAPLPETSLQAAESAYISYPPTPISDRSVTPELRYPSPVPSVRSSPVSAIRSTILHEPSPRPASLPPHLQVKNSLLPQEEGFLHHPLTTKHRPGDSLKKTRTTLTFKQC